jgi:membrane-bound serine protease (ClpP class)
LNRFLRNRKGDELTGFHQFRALPKEMKLRIVLKYGLFQMIGVTILLLVLTILRQWVNLSPMFVWGSVGLWIIKDIILLAFVWRAYEWEGSKGIHPLIGTQGVVIERLAPSGYIRVHGELWHAETMKEAVDIQENVRVQGNRGLTLLVQPCDEKHFQ